MTTATTASTTNMMFRFSALAVAGIWGLAALAMSLGGLRAQDTPPAAGADNGAATATATEDGAAAAAAQPANGSTDATASQPEEAAASARIAFVNMERVIRLYPRWWKNFEALKSKKDDNEKKLRLDQDELRNLKAEIESGADVAPAKFEEFARRSNLFEFDKRRLAAELEMEMRDLSKDVYDDVYSDIEAFTKGKYEIVLGVAEREIKTGTQTEFFQKVHVRAVILHDPRYDMTDEIIKRLELKAIKEGVATLGEINEYRKQLGLGESQLKPEDITGSGE